MGIIDNVTQKTLDAVDDVTKRTISAIDQYPRWKKPVGVLFILLGLFGVAMPALPGWPFLIVGCEALGIKLLFIDKILSRRRSKKR